MITDVEGIASLRSQFARKKKGSPFGKPFNIVYVITLNVTGLPKGKYDGDGCVLFVSLWRQK